MSEFGMCGSGACRRIGGWFLAAVIAIAGPVALGCAAPDTVVGRAATSRVAQENADGLIAKGRSLLAEGKFAEAQIAFEAAEKLDGATLKTRMWTLRSWLSQGRVNDALNEIDKLERAGTKGVEMDYLYGMAFAFKAKGYIQERAPGSVISLAFQDAVEFLARATKADPVRFADAYLPLAESAWYAQNLPVARAAAEKAVSITPLDADAHAMLGQVALAQFRTVNEDETKKAESDAHWETARAANAKVLEILSASATPEAKARLASAHVELARCYGWKRKTDDVLREYTAAIACGPAWVDYGEVQSVLGTTAFLTALEAGHKTWKETAAPEDKSDATLLWWLGFARFTEKKYADAETAFQAAVAKAPDFVNSWYYTALARYHQQKFEAAIEALKKHFAENPSDLVASIEAGRDTSVPIIDGLIGWCAERQKSADAAFLVELQVAIDPQNGRYWNNLGLFYRDAGDGIGGRGKPDEKAKAKARELWEKALVAYERAVAIDPNDPNYLNDLAVVLDYNLDRDLERAKTLYEKARVRAEEELKRKDLTPEMRGVREIALRDSKDNLEKLARRMERLRKEAEKKEAEKKDGEKRDGEKQEGEKKDGPQ